jgi:hypothetical protein
LKKVVGEVKKWLLSAKEFNETLKRAPKDRGLLVVKEYQQVLNDVRAWLEKSDTLLEQISDEPNPETKRAMAGQGG